MITLPEEIVNKIMLYAICTPSAECIKNVGELEWRFLRARYLQELYICNPDGLRNDEEVESYWNNYRRRYMRYNFDERSFSRAIKRNKELS